jgi:plastocyanin
MSTRIFPGWSLFVVAALLFVVLLAGCTGSPQVTPPATTLPATETTTPPPTPAPTTRAPATTAPPTTVATTPPVVTTTAAPATPVVPTTSDIAIQNFAFSPESITVPAGTTVTWTNQDSAPHTIVSDMTTTQSLGALFTSPQLLQGQKFTFTFRNPGTYGYHCSIHTFMKGTVTVT